jgi:hypothetical protein
MKPCNPAFLRKRPHTYSRMQKKVDKKFSAAWSSLLVFQFWLAADYDCIFGCLAECKKSKNKLSVLEKPHLYNNILRKNDYRKHCTSTFFLHSTVGQK